MPQPFFLSFRSLILLSLFMSNANKKCNILFSVMHGPHCADAQTEIFRFNFVKSNLKRNKFNILHSVPLDSIVLSCTVPNIVQHHSREVLRGIKRDGDTNVLLDCKTEKIDQVLKQAQQIGMMTPYNNYIITSLVSNALPTTTTSLLLS